MSFRDDIDRALKRIKAAANDKEIKEALLQLWKDAREYDPRWDA